MSKPSRFPRQLTEIHTNHLNPRNANPNSIDNSPLLVVAGDLRCSGGGSSATSPRGRLLEGDGPTRGGPSEARGVAEGERRRRVERHGRHGRRRGDRGDGGHGGELGNGLEDEPRLERRELLLLRLHLLVQRRGLRLPLHLRQDLMLMLMLRLGLRHGGRGSNDGLRRGRRRLGLGRRLRLEARAEEEVHLVADEARLVGEVDAERGLRLLQNGGKRGLPGPAGGAAEDGLDAAGDLLVGHHGGSVGENSNLTKTPPPSRDSPLSLSLSLSSAPSLCLWRLVSPPLSLYLSPRSSLSLSLSSGPSV